MAGAPPTPLRCANGAAKAIEGPNPLDGIERHRRRARELRSMRAESRHALSARLLSAEGHGPYAALAGVAHIRERVC
jgi:hypothetical protein